MALGFSRAAPPAPAGRAAVLLLCALPLLACGRGAEPSAQDQARRTLRTAAKPVLMIREGNPFDMDQARLNGLISSEMAAGVRGMRAQFTTSPGQAPAPEPHLVVILNPRAEPPPAAVCAAPAPIATAPASEPLRIVAVFCQGDQVLGATRTEDTVAGPTDQRFRRLLWRTASQLFPDDYEETYGFGILPRSVDFGLGGIFGD